MATIISIINEPMNRNIYDVVGRCKKIYTFNFTSISIGGLVQFAPVGRAFCLTYLPLALVFFLVFF